MAVLRLTTSFYSTYRHRDWRVLQAWSKNLSSSRLLYLPAPFPRSEFIKAEMQISATEILFQTKRSRNKFRCGYVSGVPSRYYKMRSRQNESFDRICAFPAICDAQHSIIFQDPLNHHRVAPALISHHFEIPVSIAINSHWSALE